MLTTTTLRIIPSYLLGNDCLQLLCLKLQETTSLAASTTVGTAVISDTDRRSFATQIRSLLMEVIKVRKRAKTKYITALNSYIKSLAKLMKVVKESAFDKQKVGDILSVIKKRVTLITDDLEERSTTVTSMAANGTATSIPVVKVCGYFL